VLAFAASSCTTTKTITPTTGAAATVTPNPVTKAKEKTKENPMVEILTSKGNITLELYAEKAPKTVDNFLQYVDSGFYKGTIFHRVIRSFMIQGGGFDANFSRKSTKPPVVNEASNGLKNRRGTIAMARTMVPDSATAQFFINTKDNNTLDFRDPSPQGVGYCVFGKVVDGMDVVDKIEAAATGSRNGMRDVPAENIFIKDIVRVKQN
jgi:peptidyl-prolyl cis-trans isomerase B (cyclophilin B)